MKKNVHLSSLVVSIVHDTVLSRVNLKLGSDKKLSWEIRLTCAVQKLTLVLDIIHLNCVVLKFKN